MDNLIKLTNPEFQIEFAGKQYTVRKASLSKVVQYMKKLRELKESSGDSVENGIRIIAYCIWLIVSPSDATLTEEFVYENLPGDIDPTELLVQLGFINPKRLAENLEKAPEVTPTSETSLPSSPIEQDGDPTRSENSPSTSS